MLAELIQFARHNHPTCSQFTDKQLKDFFLRYAKTTAVRTTAGKITGFCVWQLEPGAVRFMAVCLIGNRNENYRTMRKAIKSVFKDRKIIINRRAL